MDQRGGSVKKYRSQIFAAAIILVIIIIASLFHYSIHFEDAINNTVLTGYGVNISIWKIIFEPVIGLLLFFNRALYALDEFPNMLVWLLIIFVVYSLVKLILIKEKKAKFIFSQIVNIPILVGLWFTVFVVMIFVPLPNNTIINNSQNSILVTTHSHTEYSHDGLISQKGLWEWHKRNGFDAFFITDHNNHNHTLDFISAQRNNKFPIEPLVMCGEEFSGSNHLSLLGLKRKFSTKGFADSTTVDSVRANNGAVIVNHWFDGEKKSLQYFRDLGVDGFEIANSATDRSYDRKIYDKIKSFCKENNLIMNGGLDFHGYGNVCSLWNAFDIPGWHKLSPEAKEDAILNIIRNHDQSKLTVIIYKDRPYYSKANLFFSPVITFINYFRTLNFYQVLSWIIWISLLTTIKIKLSDKNKFAKQININKLIPIIGVISSLFLLALALKYYFTIRDVTNFTKMYAEYSQTLFYIGGAFLIYSGVVAFFRMRKINK